MSKGGGSRSTIALQLRQKQLDNLKMGKSLPPGLIVKTGRLVWTSLWQIMMSRLAPRDRHGAYIRPESQFRQTLDGASGNPYQPSAGRYTLVVGMSCPWAHRTLVVRALKGLEAAVAVQTVVPSPEAGGWIFEQPWQGCRTLAQLYRQAKPNYQGRATVPLLWDSQTRTIVNNESAEIIVMLEGALNDFATHPDLELYPDRLKPEIDRWNERIYHNVNNGVYRCGFAQTQAAYEQACEELFQTLEAIEAVLTRQRYLCGSLTLADVRLFTTLVRFDVAYYSLFKCSRRRIQDYDRLGAYLRDLYQLPGVAATCDLDAVRRDYYSNLFPLNPGGIVPQAPHLHLLGEHHRDKLSSDRSQLRA